MRIKEKPVKVASTKPEFDTEVEFVEANRPRKQSRYQRKQKSYSPRQLKRVEEAEERQARRKQRTPAEQLVLLDSRPGRSAKERQKLLRRSQ